MEKLELRRSKRLSDGKRAGAGTTNVSSTKPKPKICKRPVTKVSSTQSKPKTSNGAINNVSNVSSTQPKANTLNTCNSQFNTFINFFEKPISPEIRKMAPDFNPIGSMKRLQSVIEMVYIDNDEDDFEVSMYDLEAGVSWNPYTASVKREATEVAVMKNPNDSFKIEKEVEDVKLEDIKVFNMKFDPDENENDEECLCINYESSNAPVVLEKQDGLKEKLKCSNSATFKPPIKHWPIREKNLPNPFQPIVPDFFQISVTNSTFISKKLNTSLHQKRVSHVPSWKAPVFKCNSNEYIEIKPTKKIKLM